MSKLLCETCNPSKFLQPELFRTGFDREEYGKQQYATGLEWGRKSTRVSIDMLGVWGCMTKDGGSVSSYEKIGYHANTADLLRGFLDSGCEVWVYRWDMEPTQIK